MNRTAVVVSLVILGKLIALTVFLFAVMAMSTIAFGITAAVDTNPTTDSATSPAEEQELGLALIVLGVCFLHATAVTILVVASRRSGWRLILTVFALGFTMSAVLPHLESLVFLPQMSRTLIGRLVLSNALIWGLLSPFAVWLLGRHENGRTNAEASESVKATPVPHASRSVAAWSGALVSLGGLHILSYFAFGYYIAWRIPELASFYGGEDPGTLFLQLQGIASDAPWFFPFQFGRGLLWGLLAVPVAVMIRGPRIYAALAAAVVFGILASTQLLIPNPILPDVVRWAHFWETLLSRLSFGFAAVLLLRSTVVVRQKAAPAPSPSMVGSASRKGATSEPL